MSRFQYEPLGLDRRSLRLVQLQAGESGIIRCRLFDAWLDDPDGIIEYDALSYTWGESTRPFDIEMDGDFLAITRNLQLALQALRYPERDRILWVDAICIDQENEKERGHQVLQMASIYKKAEQVIVWLGIAQDESDLIFDYMTAFEQEAYGHPCNSWEPTDNRWNGIAKSLPVKTNETHILAFKNLLQRRWFARVWIIQEIANARAAKIVCGSRSVAARIFAVASMLVMQNRHRLSCQAILDVMPGPARKSSWWNTSQNLSTLLYRFRSSEATDPRDRIYALLGISSDASTMGTLAPNYEKNEREVVYDTIAFLLRIDQSSMDSRFLHDWSVEDLFNNLKSLSNQVLLHASENGYQAIVSHLLRTGDIDTNFADEHGNSALHLAAANGQYDVVQSLLGRVSEVNTPNKLGWTPLWLAAVNGQQPVVDLLCDQEEWHFKDTHLRKPRRYMHLRHLSLFDDQNKHKLWITHFSQAGQADEKHSHLGLSPLCWAAKIGHIELFKVLADCTLLNVNKEKVDGFALIRWMAEHANKAIFAYMLNMDAVKTDRRPNVWQDLWEWAIRSHRVEVIEALMNAGRTFTTSNSLVTEQPLTFAVRDGNEAIVEMLLGQIHTDQISASDARHAMLVTITSGKPDILRLLLRNKSPKINLEYFGGFSPLYTACKSGQEEIAGILLQYSDLDWPNSTKSESLYVAAGSGHTKIVKLLLDSSTFDLNWRDTEGRTPLRRAAGFDFPEIVKMLLESGRVDVNARDEQGQTALWRAAHNGLHGVVALLLAAPDIDHDAADWVDWQTPLAAICQPQRRNSVEVVEVLLATAKVNPWLKDKAGRTALESAKLRVKDRESIINLLQEYMTSPEIIEHFATKQEQYPMGPKIS